VPVVPHERDRDQIGLIALKRVDSTPEVLAADRARKAGEIRQLSAETGLDPASQPVDLLAVRR
jgi:hypothetical protein